MKLKVDTQKIAGRVQEAVADHLEPDENVQICAFVIRIPRFTKWIPAGNFLFKGHGLALTNRRLLLTKGGMGATQRPRKEIAFVYQRQDLTVESFAKGGRLQTSPVPNGMLALGLPDGRMELRFYWWWNDDLTRIAEALASDPTAGWH